MAGEESGVVEVAKYVACIAQAVSGIAFVPVCCQHCMVKAGKDALAKVVKETLTQGPAVISFNWKIFMLNYYHTGNIRQFFSVCKVYLQEGRLCELFSLPGGSFSISAQYIN